MAGIDVDQFWRGGSCTCRWWWEATSCFLDQAGNGDTVVLVNVVGVGGVIPFVGGVWCCWWCWAGDVGVLGFVGCVELICMIVKPKFQLFLWCSLLELCGWSPRFCRPAEGWNVGIAGL